MRISQFGVAIEMALLDLCLPAAHFTRLVRQALFFGLVRLPADMLAQAHLVMVILDKKGSKISVMDYRKRENSEVTLCLLALRWISRIDCVI